MSAGHTEGPWEARPGGLSGRWLVDAPGRRFIAQMDGPPNEEGEANARLIAAAPEGYDLIEQLEESFTADAAYEQFLPAMRAYLAKVRGQ